MSAYADELKQIEMLLSSGGLRDAVGKLSPDEFKKLHSALPYLRRTLSMLQEAVTDSHLDRTIDWKEYTKHARKHFNDLDIQILEALALEDGYYVTYAGIQTYVEAPKKPTINEIRKRTRRLMRLGLVTLAKGLFDEDGETAGSGFGINVRRAAIVSDIKQAYSASDKQEALL